ncbi:nitroreductase family protein [Lentisphaerota bacterium ZTH]|nr:nitroreductase family protein [Lentisphaerota bacterium]WET06282.1 nitroreductase family protein [Lentisphaerota bacterium ZTH]
MEFYDVINRRRSMRGYKPDPIPAESLERIAHALQAAPSACNLQPWKFLYIENKDLLGKICSVYSRDWLAEAPAVIVALGNSEDCWRRIEGTPIIDIDVGIAMEHIVLAAAAENLDTCWICAYEVKRLDRVLNIQHPWSALAISPIGYGSKEPRELERKPLEQIFEVIK